MILRIELCAAENQTVILSDPMPLTGSPVLDPWRIRRQLALSGKLQAPPPRAEQRATLSERILWSLLAEEPPGWHREYSTGLFRLDFYCPSARVAVEVDGGSHYGQLAAERDALRDDWHRLRGIATRRFSAREVESQPQWVLQQIRELVAPPSDQQLEASVDVEPPVDRPGPAEAALLAEAQRIADQLVGVTAEQSAAAEDEARLTVEQAFAEACRTVLPRQQSVLRQVVELFGP